MNKVRYDEIGYWSELKLDILQQYASAYSRILSRQGAIRAHIYIDAFAGAGVHISRATGQFVLGSPLNALNVEPSFKEFHFIDLDGGKAEHLRNHTRDRADVFVYNEDCNRVLLDTVFPRARHEDYRRALCLLDPYALNLDWEVIRTAGSMRSVEIFLNFMVMDMNMNVLLRDPTRVDPRQAERMTRFWGDASWKAAAYTTEGDLFGHPEKTDNEDIAQAFRERLLKVGGFSFVPDPLPMRNSIGSTVYYLFFASQNAVGGKIVGSIFSKYRNRGIQ